MSGSLQPPVIRAIVDGQARSLVLPLRPGLSVLFDAGTCRLRKVWAGGVQHGSTIGDSYVEDRLLNPTWRVRRGNSADRVPAVFAGYRVRKGVVTLLYDIPFAGEKFRVEETLTATENRLERTFLPVGMPNDVRLSLMVPLDARQTASTNASLTDAEEVGISPNSGLLTLRPEGPTTLSTSFNLAAPGKFEIPPRRAPAKTYETSDRPFPFATSLVSETPSDSSSFTVMANGRAVVGDRSRVFVLATGQVLASGLDECFALHVVRGKLWVLQMGELTELNDSDGDTIIDEYLVRATGWPAIAGRDFSVTPDGIFVVTLFDVVEVRSDGTVQTMTETAAGATSLSNGPNNTRLIASPGAFTPWNGGPPLRIPSNGPPSNMVPLTGKTFAGQYVFGRLDGPGVWRWLPETSNGALQGAMIPISAAWAERLAGDNFLAMGGGQLVSIRPRPGPYFEIVDVGLRANGIEFVVSESMSAGMGLAPDDYAVETREGKRLTVKSVSVNRWRNKVFLEIPGLAAGQLVQVRLNQGLTSTANRLLGARDFWYSIGHLPEKPGVVAATNPTPDPAGFTKVELNGPEGYTNFEVRFRWRQQPGGNTGLYLRVPNDAEPRKTSLRVVLGAPVGGGSLDLFEPAKHRPLRETGHWNESRLIVQGGVIEHWLNGLRVWRFNLDNVNTRARILATDAGKNPGYAKARAGRLVFEGGATLAESISDLRIRRLR